MEVWSPARGDAGEDMRLRLACCIVKTLCMAPAVAMADAPPPPPPPPLAIATPSEDPAAFAARIGAAVNQHPAVLAAIAAQRAARQARREARAAFRPSLDLNLTGDGSIAREFEDDFDNIVERSRPRARANATLSGNQLLYDAGGTSARVEGAEARIGESEQAVLTAAVDVALAAVAAYHQVVESRALIMLGEEFAGRHRDILAQVEQRFREGVGARRDVARVEARLADAEARLSGFERSLAEAESRYLELFREAPPPLLLPAPVASAASSEDEAIALAVGNNPDVEAARYRAEAAAKDYRAERAGALPSVSLGIDATKFDLGEERTDFDIRGRVVMRYNLYTGGAQSARMAQALQRWRQTQHDEERARREVERDVTIAFRTRAVLARRVEVLERALRANADARAIYLEQFRVARGTLLDVLEAEDDYFNAAVVYLRGLIEAEMARFRLLAQTGELLDKLDIRFSFAEASDLFGSGR
ncbi:MAG: hypothetical protein D6782_01035 [Alphaproteobacteria bacterium]|nr:MAG: hypothetical protein D6782_01035 [Alphaproteobacteria bacterium]